MKDPIAKRAPFLHVSDPSANRYLARLEGKKRLHLIRGDKKILPGIELLLTPGHTPGMQAVAVNTAKGTAIVGSDLAHVAVSYRNDIPSAIITDMSAWMKSFDKVRAKASSLDLLFPGHDPALLENYPKVAEDVSGSFNLSGRRFSQMYAEKSRKPRAIQKLPLRGFPELIS